MLINFASDFHFHLPYFTYLANAAPRFDLTVYGGDLLDVRPGKPPASRQIDWCRDWLGAFPGEIYCAEGNHDADDRIDLPKPEAGWLHRLGLPHVKTAGLQMRCGHQFEIMPWGGEPLAELQDSGSVWISHSPPHGSKCAITPHGIDFGDLTLGGIVDLKFGAWLLLSGHVHSCRSWHDYRGVTNILNPQVNRINGPVPNHIVIDTVKRHATWHSGRTVERIALR